MILIHHRHRRTDGQTDGRHAISIPRYALKCITVKTFPTPRFDAIAWHDSVRITRWALPQRTLGCWAVWWWRPRDLIGHVQ